MNRIEKHFEQARENKSKSLVLFLTAGFPNLQTTAQIITRIDEAGCDVLELGVPFSDPIADGPTIQASSSEALKTGTTLEKILDLVAEVRKTSQIPILLFGAYNPFLHYGHEALMKRSVEVGVDGFLVPDVPLEESTDFEAACRAADLSLIYLIAPTTPEDRMKQIAARASGFLYYISLKGVTGTEIVVTDELREHVAMLQRIADPIPVAVGFGVQTPEHARQTAEAADAVVVGSSLIRLIGEYRDAPDLLDRVAEYTRSLKAAI